MLSSGPNYLSHKSEKRPPRYLVGCKDKVCSSEEWLSADGASPAEPDVPFRQTAKFSIEHVYRGICRHLSGNHPIDWYSNVRYRTVGCTVRDVAQSLQVPEPLPHFGSAPRFSLLAGKVGGHMMTLQASCRSGHYVAAVMPMIDTTDRSEYQVLVFRQGHEVYQQTERSLEDAIRTASAYLDRQNEQDFDS